MTDGGPSKRAFEELLGDHLDALYRTALRLCGGREAEAEDLLQQAVLRAFRGFSNLENAEAGRAWLFTVLARTHLNRERAAGRRAETVSSDMEPEAFERALESWRPSRTPEEAYARRDLGRRLSRALDGLPAPLREVVWLADVEGFRLREVAGMLEIPEGTVASRLYRARRRLREALEADRGGHEGKRRRR